MPNDTLSRRSVMVGGAGIALAAPLPAMAAATRMSAAALLTGGTLPAEAASTLASATLIHGSGDTQVTGIMVATMPSLAVLRQAVASGCNLILSAEAPLYSRPLPADANPMARAGAERLFAQPVFRENPLSSPTTSWSSIACPPAAKRPALPPTTRSSPAIWRGRWA
jgi:hypothetical protein